MAFMEYDDSLLTGIRVIDDQHRRLIDIINDMYDKVLGCGSIDEERVFAGRFLSELRKYAQSHFADEEGMLLAKKYPDIQFHQEEHKIFIEELGKLEDRFRQREPALSAEVFIFARDWIAHHLKNSDRDYIEYVK